MSKEDTSIFKEDGPVQTFLLGLVFFFTWPWLFIQALIEFIKTGDFDKIMEIFVVVLVSAILVIPAVFAFFAVCIVGIIKLFAGE